MKRLFTILLAVLLLVGMTACGGNPNAKAIVGTWELVDKETETEYGLGIEFTGDGKLRYGLTSDVLAGLSGGEDVDEALEGLDMLMDITYKITSDTEMEVTISAMFGLAKETTKIPYALNGDTLEFDGATYARVKN